MNPNIEQNRYIGDGVYASFDGWHIILQTWKDRPGDYDPERMGHVHRIALEGPVLERLMKYAAHIKEENERAAKERE
jgi:hypothetical protein